MDPVLLLAVITGIVILSYLFSQVLDFLNLKALQKHVPAEIAAFYDPEKYSRLIDYQRSRMRFGFITSALSFSVSLGMILSGGFGWLYDSLYPLFTNEIVLALVFFGILAVGSDLISIPFQWYTTFTIEEKFGFNKITPRLFVTDKLKGYLLGAVIGGALITALIWLVIKIGPAFWLWFGLLASAFVLLVNMFYTTLFIPLFNKLTPLPDGPLKASIEVFAGKVNFPLDNIFVMDGSKRSSKANAFFSGIGKKKKIVLYDTLIQNHTTEELVAILAHEVGHFKKKHIIWGYILSVGQIFFMLFVLSKMVFDENLSLALGASHSGIPLNLLAFGILFSPISSITGLLLTLYSRRNEYQADAYACEMYDGSSLASALKKLSVDTLSNLYPHPAYVFFHYSHPPLLQRLAAIQSGKGYQASQRTNN